VLRVLGGACQRRAGMHASGGLSRGERPCPIPRASIIKDVVG
jgi:hypothetical protein